MRKLKRFSKVDELKKRRSQTSIFRKKRVTLPFSLSDLICGLDASDDQLTAESYPRLVLRLKTDVNELFTQLSSLLSEEDNLRISTVFPFLARKFLELSLIAMLARIDPIRVIAASKNQIDDSYEVGKPNESSIAWAADIFSKDKQPIDIHKKLWSNEILKKGIERSLLGWHVSSVIVEPCLLWLSDQDRGRSNWLKECSSKDDKLGWIKGHLLRLYSTFSKGIHAEYLIDDRSMFDRATIVQQMNDLLMTIFILATALHASPLAARSIPISQAIDLLEFAESNFEKKKSK